MTNIWRFSIVTVPLETTQFKSGNILPAAAYLYCRYSNLRRFEMKEKTKNILSIMVPVLLALLEGEGIPFQGVYHLLV